MLASAYALLVVVAGLPRDLSCQDASGEAELLCCSCCSAGVAWAHHTGSDDSPWRNELALWLPLAVSGAWYALGFIRLRPRASVVSRSIRRNGILFFLGWSTLVASLLSPLHEYGEVSFTAHMTEHELLMLVAAPLMALSRPLAVFLWACPDNVRRALVDRHATAAVVSRYGRTISDPIVATGLQICALWAWHMPALFDLALRSEEWHAIQHLSFLLSCAVVLVVADSRLAPGQPARDCSVMPLRHFAGLRRLGRVDGHLREPVVRGICCVGLARIAPGRADGRARTSSSPGSSCGFPAGWCISSPHWCSPIAAAEERSRLASVASHA